MIPIEVEALVLGIIWVPDILLLQALRTLVIHVRRFVHLGDEVAEEVVVMVL